MANLTRWRTTTPAIPATTTTRTLRGDIDDIVDRSVASRELRSLANAELRSLASIERGFRKELDRLLREDLSPRKLRREVHRVLDELIAPPPVARRPLKRLLSDAIAQVPLRAQLSDVIAQVPLRAQVTELLGKVENATGLTLLKPRRDLFATDSELLTESVDAWIVSIELPGVRESDVDIRVNGETLVISGECRQESTKRAQGYEYIERSHGLFTRSIELPRGVDTANIEASFQDGILSLRIAKNAPARVRQISLQQQQPQSSHGHTPTQPRAGFTGPPRRSGMGTGMGEGVRSGAPRFFHANATANGRRSSSM